ncbi:MAG: hypothetical protein AAF658_04105, partial [Myxococcota bacterium]
TQMQAFIVVGNYEALHGASARALQYTRDGQLEFAASVRRTAQRMGYALSAADETRVLNALETGGPAPAGYEALVASIREGHLVAPVPDGYASVPRADITERFADLVQAGGHPVMSAQGQVFDLPGRHVLHVDLTKLDADGNPEVLIAEDAPEHIQALARREAMAIEWYYRQPPSVRREIVAEVRRRMGRTEWNRFVRQMRGDPSQSHSRAHYEFLQALDYDPDSEMNPELDDMLGAILVAHWSGFNGQPFNGYREIRTVMEQRGLRTSEQMFDDLTRLRSENQPIELGPNGTFLVSSRVPPLIDRPRHSTDNLELRIYDVIRYARTTDPRTGGTLERLYDVDDDVGEVGAFVEAERQAELAVERFEAGVAGIDGAQVETLDRGSRRTWIFTVDGHRFQLEAAVSDIDSEADARARMKLMLDKALSDARAIRTELAALRPTIVSLHRDITAQRAAGTLDTEQDTGRLERAEALSTIMERGLELQSLVGETDFDLAPPRPPRVQGQVQDDAVIMEIVARATRRVLSDSEFGPMTRYGATQMLYEIDRGVGGYDGRFYGDQGYGCYCSGFAEGAAYWTRIYGAEVGLELSAISSSVAHKISRDTIFENVHELMILEVEEEHEIDGEIVVTTAYVMVDPSMGLTEPVVYRPDPPPGIPQYSGGEGNYDMATVELPGLPKSGTLQDIGKWVVDNLISPVRVRDAARSGRLDEVGGPMPPVVFDGVGDDLPDFLLGDSRFEVVRMQNGRDLLVPLNRIEGSDPPHMYAIMLLYQGRDERGRALFKPNIVEVAIDQVHATRNHQAALNILPDAFRARNLKASGPNGMHVGITYTPTVPGPDAPNRKPRDVEQRVRAMGARAEREGAQVANDVLLFLAENLQGSTRDAEDAIARLIAHADVTGKPITVEYARSLLARRIAGGDQRHSVRVFGEMGGATDAESAATYFDATFTGLMVPSADGTTLVENTGAPDGARTPQEAYPDEVVAQWGPDRPPPPGTWALLRYVEYHDLDAVFGTSPELIVEEYLKVIRYEGRVDQDSQEFGIERYMENDPMFLVYGYYVMNPMRINHDKNRRWDNGGVRNAVASLLDRAARAAGFGGNKVPDEAAALS